MSTSVDPPRATTSKSWFVAPVLTHPEQPTSKSWFVAPVLTHPEQPTSKSWFVAPVLTHPEQPHLRAGLWHQMISKHFSTIVVGRVSLLVHVKVYGIIQETDEVKDTILRIKLLEDLH
ncbi:talin-2 X4 [Biomphalaria glabrata]|nr:talin-2 X4 [Biomphalaria glabrata]